MAITSDSVVSRPNSEMFHKLFLLLYTTFTGFKGKQLHICNNALGCFLFCWKHLQIRNVVLKFDLEVLIHYASLSVEIVYSVVIHRRADSPFSVKWVFQKYLSSYRKRSNLFCWTWLFEWIILTEVFQSSIIRFYDYLSWCDWRDRRTCFIGETFSRILSH